MPLNFEPRPGSAVDIINNITIPQPRILPASFPEDPSHTEYQYAIYKNDTRIDGLGLFGSDWLLEKDRRREGVFSLDLGREWVLDSIFRFKEKINDKCDDFDFLKSLACGLLLPYQNRDDNDDDVRYLALTKTDS